MRWRTAYLRERRPETPDALTLVLDVDGWPGHLPGQHVDVRLTAPDGYSTQRSYSIAAPSDGPRVELTVQLVPDGEVSSYLVQDYTVGDPVEIRGPVGGWFVWRPGQEGPVTLVGGGSGIVPLMAMARGRHGAAGSGPFRLVYSVRRPVDVFYADELRRLSAAREGFESHVVHTREAPPGSGRAAGRLRPEELAELTWPAEQSPLCFVCGPSGFVEHVAQILLEAGHDPSRIRAERFGPGGA